MKIVSKDPPRTYTVGLNDQITIKDCGSIYLESNEQVTFVTSSDSEYDVARKEWGFYATPSVNGRLKKFSFKTALVKNSMNNFYVMLVEIDKLPEFNAYLKEESQEVVSWLDELT